MRSSPFNLSLRTNPALLPYSHLPYAVLVAAGVGQIFELDLGGRLLFSDIVLILALPVLLLSKGRALLSRDPKHLLSFGALWLCGAVLTDTIRQTPVDDLARGWSKILFVTANFASIYLLVGEQPKRLIMFLASIFAGGVLKLAFFPSAETGVGPLGSDIFGTAWRFGYGQAFTFFAFLFGVWLSKHAGFAAEKSVQAGAAVIDLALQARNLFGISSMSLLLSVAVGRPSKRPVSLLRLAVVGSVTVLAAWLTLSAYAYVASEGMLGPEAQEKYLKQSSGSFGLILGGRTESLASTQAILDSPIIGHGSWARDTYYVMLKVQALEEAGYKYEGDPFKTDLIPTHSILLGAWVESGILGALFWFWALFLTFQALLALTRDRPKLTPVLTFILLSLLWDILFSPLGLERRFVEPAYLCTAMMAIRHRFSS